MGLFLLLPLLMIETFSIAMIVLHKQLRGDFRANKSL